jgi:hypothetical protein
MTWPRIDGLRTLELGTPGALRKELTALVLSGRTPVVCLRFALMPEERAAAG